MENTLVSEVNVKIDAPVEKVWEALTDPEMIKKYFYDTVIRTDWIPGNPIKFTGEFQGKKYEDKGTVKAIEPFSLIQYNYWSSMSGLEDCAENYSNITYKLTKYDGGTLLTVIQDNIKSEKLKEHSTESWKTVIDNLKQLIEA